MLKNIDPLIGPELLGVLASMGHGDEIAIVDANFPATSIAAQTVYGTALRMDHAAIRCLEAVLSLFPLDSFEPGPVLTMQVVGDPAAIPEVVANAAPLLAREGVKSASLDRFAFYRRAEGCFAILHTAETRLYGNFILRKGVIAPAGAKI